MKLPTIQSLWIGGSLSKLEQLCVQSFLDHGHEFHLYTYDKVAGIPNGATVKDGNEIIPSKLIFRYSNGSYAGFSNWFRYEMLAKLGGFWVDMDMVCIKPLDFTDSLIIGNEGPRFIGTALIGCQPNNELILALRHACRNYPAFSPWDSATIKLRKLKQRIKFRKHHHAEHGTVGAPRSLTEAMRYMKIEQNAKPTTYFYPIWIEDFDKMFDHTYANKSPFSKHTHTLHMWNGRMSSRADITKNSDFHPNSLIEQLKRKHKIK